MKNKLTRIISPILSIILIITVLLFQPKETRAVAAWVQSSSNGANSVTTINSTPASNVTAWNLIVLVTHNNTTETPSVSDNQSNTYTQHIQVSNDRELTIFSTIAASTGSLTVTLTTVGSNRLGLSVNEFSGSWDSSRVDGTPASATGTGTAVSSGNTTTTGNAVFVGGVSISSVTTGCVLGVGYSNLDSSDTGRFCSESKVITGATTDDADFTATSNNWAAAVVAFKEVAASANPQDIIIFKGDSIFKNNVIFK